MGAERFTQWREGAKGKQTTISQTNLLPTSAPSRPGVSPLVASSPGYGAGGQTADEATVARWLPTQIESSPFSQVGLPVVGHSWSPPP